MSRVFEGLKGTERGQLVRKDVEKSENLLSLTRSGHSGQSPSSGEDQGPEGPGRSRWVGSISG